jgi:hypothetical protein
MPVFPISVDQSLVVYQTDIEWVGEIGVAERVQLLNTLLPTRDWVVSEGLNIVYSLSPVAGRSDTIRLHTSRPVPAHTIPVSEWFGMAANMSDGTRFPIVGNSDVIHLNGHTIRLIRAQGAASGWAVVVTARETKSSPLQRVICLGRKYRIVEESLVPPSKQEVEIGGVLMSVAQYYSQKGIELKHQDSGAMYIDSAGRFLPKELCQVESNNPPTGNDTFASFLTNLSRFGLSIDHFKPLTAHPRRIDRTPPVAAPLFSNRPSVRFSVISFASNDEVIADMVGRLSESTGVSFVSTGLVIKVNKPSWESEFRLAISGAEKIDIFFVLFNSSRIETHIYNRLKLVTELKLGVPSQFVSVDRMVEVGELESYWDSLGAQIVGKVFTKMALLQPIGKAAPSTYVVGIWTETIPRTTLMIVGICMSLDHSFGSFIQKVCVTKRTAEFDPSIMFYELLLKSFEINLNFPTRIVSFRRHVEGSMFNRLAHELKAWDAAISRLNRESKTGINPRLGNSAPRVNPNITLIHCNDDSGICLPDDHLPAVIEERIVDGKGLNFYMQLGPSKSATHYRVLHDQNNFTVSEIITFTNHLCAHQAQQPGPLAHCRKLVQRSKLYIDSEWKSINEMRKSRDDELAQYLNQKLFSELSTLDILNTDGKSSHI